MTNAPGPKGSLIWGSLPDFKKDPLDFMATCIKEHGDIVKLRFGPITTHLLNHPDYAEQVLSRNPSIFNKNTRSASRIAATTGDSLLSANHTMWKRHREIIQPQFQPNNFNNIGPILDTLIDPMLKKWRSLGTIDIVDEMMQLLIAASIKILFSAEIDARALNDSLEVVLADTWRRIEAPLDASLISPFFHRAKFKTALNDINSIVLGLIQKRRASSRRPNDVLTKLIDAHETTQDAPLSDQELRDAAVTMLLAGHETTANAISWAFIHGASQMDASADNIFAEAIRLYPSIWIIERNVVQDTNIGGFDIPRGSSVMISPYIMHRNPNFWPDPESFAPSRFPIEQRQPRYSYLPFGFGPHRCIGLHLANKMAAQIIDKIRSHVNLALLPNQPLAIKPQLTLRHKEPVLMKLE